jgi:serine/threonine protein kinase
MLADGVFAFTRKVDAKSFKVLCAILTSTADSGAGTLRNALTNAADGGTINFSITGTITLTTGELLFTNNVTILDGAKKLRSAPRPAGLNPEHRPCSRVSPTYDSLHNPEKRRMSEESTCPSCGAVLVSNSPGGLCESCFLALGVATEQQTAKAEEPRSTIQVVFPMTERPGDRIGQYKLLRQIGEGGMGTVWEAEQMESVRRRVALKVIKLGTDTKQVIARFEAERQALALMNHASIAKVLDAGATSNGRPFFVMELVAGDPITTFCDKHKLSTCERLELFVEVCQALQHAHQKGIIHRDVKPSNILVTYPEGAGAPVPKVIDFGIAKATAGQRLTDKTLITQFEQFIGTPAYVSPEQVEMTGVDIDTRSDIYSLGVLLYELLTGKRPFEDEELLKEGLDKMRQIIREVDPPRPSTRLSTANATEQTRLARHRHCDPPKLLRLIRGDLDWIVMKTLEKDRNRRYETANGLAMDIKRFLNNDLVAARPPSRIYQFQKIVRKNKLAFGATAAVVISLLLGIVASTWLYFRERDAEDEAKRQRDNAQNQATRAAASENEAKNQRDYAESLRRSSDLTLTFLKNTLYAADTYNVRDQTLKLDYFFNYAETNLNWLESDPRATAVALSALGRIASNWGRYDQAKVWLQGSERFWRELEKTPEPKARKAAGIELADVLNYLAWATVGDQQNKTNLTDRAHEAEPLAKEAFEKRKSLMDPYEDQTLCLQADWLRLRQLAGTPNVIVFQAFLDYLAAWAGQTREEFCKSLTNAIVSSVQLADAGNRKEAQQRIRQFSEPLFDPAKPLSRIRLPRALANAGEGIRNPSVQSSAVASFLHVSQHQLQVCGALLIEVAAQLGSEMLPHGHPDLEIITRLAASPENKSDF